MKSVQTMDTAIGHHRYELVNGDFSPADAREVITHLIETKINFLRLKNFSHQVRFDRTDDESLQQIDHLTESKESIHQLIDEAMSTGRSILVKSNITITLS